MKTKLYPLFILSFVLLLTSCKKTIIQTTTDKTVGKWRFEKVKVNRGLSLTSDDITTDYEDVIIEFKADNTMIETDQTGEKTGIWKIETYYYTVDEATTSGTRLVGALSDQSGQELSIVSWDNFSVWRSKITCNANDGNDRYRYKLVKL